MTRGDFFEGSDEGSIEELRRLAYRDYLTGIPNRRFFMEELSSRLLHLSGTGRFLLVGIIDLNGFKTINDLYGHKIGDRILVEVGARLSGRMEPGDLMARLGGDEFAFIISDFVRISGARDRIEGILAEIARPIILEGMEKSLTLGGSIGATLYPDDDGDSRTLLHHADLALYEVKRRRQSSWSFYLSESFPEGNADDNPNHFQEVLSVGQVEFYFQPQVDLSDGTVCGAEVSISFGNGSWPERRETSLTFPAGEQPALVRKGGRYALFHTMEALRQGKDRELELYLSVDRGNDPARAEIFSEDLLPALIEFQDVVHRLVLQVTQSVAHAEFDRIRALFSEIHRFGALVAVDDFGRGALSLPSLMKLEPDRVVLDSGLVSGMMEDPRNLGLVFNILLAGATTGTEVIATGIDGASHLRILREIGCREGRGKVLGFPAPEQKFFENIREKRSPVFPPVSRRALSLDEILLLFVKEEPLFWIESHRALFYSGEDSLSEEALLLAGNRALCGLGRWLSGPGRKRFGSQEAFMEIAALHDRFHDLADTLLVTARSPGGNRRLNDGEREAVRLDLERLAGEFGALSERLDRNETNRR